MRTNKEERNKLLSLMKGLDYLRAGLIENKDSDYQYGIERITNWLKMNDDFFTELYHEINRK